MSVAARRWASRGTTPMRGMSARSGCHEHAESQQPVVAMQSLYQQMYKGTSHSILPVQCIARQCLPTHQDKVLALVQVMPGHWMGPGHSSQQLSAAFLMGIQKPLCRLWV